MMEKEDDGIPGFLSAESMALIRHALETGIPEKVPDGLSREKLIEWFTDRLSE